MTTGRLLHRYERKRIDVYSYGSATMIPNNFFGYAENIVCKLDIVPMTNPLAYTLGLLSNKYYNMRVVESKTSCPYKAHGFREDTYAGEVTRNGDLFQGKYFAN